MSPPRLRNSIAATAVVFLVALIARRALARHSELRERVARLEHLMVGVGYRPPK